MPSIVTRTTSGLLFSDTFARSDRNLHGDNGWVVQRGTWAITSGQVATSTGILEDRVIQTGVAARSEMAVQMGLLLPTTNDEAGAVLLGADSTHRFIMRAATAGYSASIWAGDYYNVTAADHYTDNPSGYQSLGIPDFQLPVNTLTTVLMHVRVTSTTNMTTNAYKGTGTAVEGPDHAGGPSSSPILDGQPGFVVGYGGSLGYAATGVRFSNFLALGGIHVTCAGLSGTQGFRLHNGSGTVLASSGAQSGGTATAHAAGLMPFPAAASLQVYDDAGTWAVPSTGLRWPDSGTSPVYGGDAFTVGPAGPLTYGLQVNWTDTTDNSTFWDQPYVHVHDIGCITALEAELYRGDPDLTAGRLRATFDDPNWIARPFMASSPLYPNVDAGRWVRLVATEHGVTIPLWVGKITDLEIDVQPPLYSVVLSAQDPLSLLLATKVTPTFLSSGWVYNDAAPTQSALVALLSAVHDLPEANWALAPGISAALPATGWGGKEITLQQGLTELATLADAAYWLEPLYRETAGGLDYVFVWGPRDAKAASADDFTLSQPAGDARGGAIRPSLPLTVRPLPTTGSS